MIINVAVMQILCGILHIINVLETVHYKIIRIINIIHKIFQNVYVMIDIFGCKMRNIHKNV
jgi:hypothetical protein